MKYDAIVFDFDGTLVQSNEIKTWAFGKLYEKYGEDFVRQVTDYHLKHTGISRFIKFRHCQEHLLGLTYTDELGKHLSHNYSQLVFDSILQAPYVEGVLKFLEKYYLKVTLFVASGTPEAELRKIIFRRGMSRYFSNVYGSPATKKAILRLILSTDGWRPERGLIGGDSIVDLEGAQCTKIDFIGVDLSKDLSVFSNSKCISNFFQLEMILEGIGNEI